MMVGVSGARVGMDGWARTKQGSQREPASLGNASLLPPPFPPFHPPHSHLTVRVFASMVWSAFWSVGGPCARSLNLIMMLFEVFVSRRRCLEPE